MAEPMFRHSSFDLVLTATMDVSGNGTLGTVVMPNYGYGLDTDPDHCVFTDLKNIKRSDLCAYTNGVNSENYDQQGIQFEAEWDVSNAGLKHIFGRNQSLYQRICDGVLSLLWTASSM